MHQNITRIQNKSKTAIDGSPPPRTLPTSRPLALPRLLGDRCGWIMPADEEMMFGILHFRIFSILLYSLAYLLAFSVNQLHPRQSMASFGFPFNRSHFLLILMIAKKQTLLDEVSLGAPGKQEPADEGKRSEPTETVDVLFCFAERRKRRGFGRGKGSGLG